jgi:hypothetical protein
VWFMRTQLAKIIIVIVDHVETCATVLELLRQA